MLRYFEKRIYLLFDSLMPYALDIDHLLFVDWFLARVMADDNELPSRLPTQISCVFRSYFF